MAEGEESIDWAALEGLDGGVPPMESGQHIITSEQMAKRLLWDVVPCPMARDVRDYLGYSAASDDVEEMEHEESHARLELGSPAIPLIYQMSVHAVTAIVGSMIVGSGDVDNTPIEIRDEVISKQVPVVSQATYAILVELLDTGFLHFPHIIAVPEGS